MTKSYKEVLSDLSPFLGKMRKEMPDAMKGFDALSQAAKKEGVLNPKTKELIAIALAVAARCEGCIAFHTQTLVKLGMTREELLETLSMALLMGGGPSLMYAAEALKAFEELSAQP